MIYHPLIIKHGVLENPRTEWSFEEENHLYMVHFPLPCGITGGNVISYKPLESGEHDDKLQDLGRKNMINKWNLRGNSVEKEIK